MPSAQEFRDRLALLAHHMNEKDVDAVIITPGANLRYFIGYDAIPLERITALVVRQKLDPVLLVPRLERSTALVSPFGQLGFELLAWGENDDPYQLIANSIGNPQAVIAVDNHMWAERVLALQSSFGAEHIVLAAPIIELSRIVKTPTELDHLREAASAIDRVHAQVPELLRPGRTEREVGRDIAELIISEGHEHVDFVIVASGPNAASPHHELSDRVLQVGDPIVVDIGGTMPSGYCSDCTRTYHLGDPTEEYASRYDTLLEAQIASTHAVFDGVLSHDIDAAGRDILEDAGLAEFFIHRTGHGIGLETHEEPYIGQNNHTVIRNHMAFSIEPGFYVEGQYGARIEDIVICTPNGPESINKQPRELVIVSP